MSTDPLVPTMNALAQNAPFSTVNPHALASILEAGQTKSIIAPHDIFDISGIKLWARDQPVSNALQRKLLDRQLRNPLESCLMAEDGPTPRALPAKWPTCPCTRWPNCCSRPARPRARNPSTMRCKPWRWPVR
jgi:hypothetical protein